MPSNAVDTDERYKVPRVALLWCRRGSCAERGRLPRLYRRSRAPSQEPHPPAVRGGAARVSWEGTPV